MGDGIKNEEAGDEARETAGLGLSAEERRRFLIFADGADGREERAALLRGKRRRLLDEIHERQRIIDNIDCLIWQWRKRKEE